MEEHEPFTFFRAITPLYDAVEDLMGKMGWPFNNAGLSWTGAVGGPYDLRHEPGHGAEAFFHVMLVAALLLGLGGYVYTQISNKEAALVPSNKLSIVNVFEILVGTAYGMMKDIMGEKQARFFLPLIGTCAFFILFSNALGLIPGFHPPTSSLDVTLACGLIIFVCTHAFGVKEHGLAYFKHFFGPVIKWYALPLMLLMFAIEMVSHCVRPLSLGIRLMGNMFADHKVVGIFLGLAYLVAHINFPFFIPVPVMLLGALVVVVQTLVFCLLSTVYIAMAVEHSEDH